MTSYENDIEAAILQEEAARQRELEEFKQRELEEQREAEEAVAKLNADLDKEEAYLKARGNYFRLKEQAEEAARIANELEAARQQQAVSEEALRQAKAEFERLEKENEGNE